MKLEYAGQNENNGFYPKKFEVIFFQPLLLDSKHGVNIILAFIWSIFLKLPYIGQNQDSGLYP